MRKEREAEIHIFEDRLVYIFQIPLKTSSQRSKTFNDSRQDKHKENHTYFHCSQVAADQR